MTTLTTGTVQILGVRYPGAVVLACTDRSARIAYDGECFAVGADQLEPMDVDALPLTWRAKEVTYD
jgi:hypothetical protein